MDLETTQITTTAKFPTLKQENGNSFKPAAKTTINADGTSTILIPGLVTTEENVQKKNDMKARNAKTLFVAIQTRFGGNEATKKTQKTLLKQMYENFSAPSTKSLDSIFNRLQKIVSQLAILGENISQEDLNFKFLRSLPSEWNIHVVVWRNKPDLDTMSFDDLYNNFKIVEQEVKGTVSSSSSTSSQNMAFVSSPSSTNEINTAYGVSTANTQVSPASTQVSTASTQVSTANLSDDTVYAFLASQPNGSQLVYEDLEQIHEDDIEEMDLKWQLALLSMRTRRFFQKTGRKITINGSDTAGYDKSKVECFNCHKMGHFARECRGPRNQDSRNRNQDSSRRTVNVEETSSKAMLAINRAGFDWSYMADDEVPTNMVLMAFSDSEFNKSEFNLANYKRGLASVEENLVFYKKNEEFQQPEFEGYEPKTSNNVSKDTSNEVRESPDAQMVEKLVLDDKERVVSGNNYTSMNYNYSAKKAHPSAHRNMAPRAVLMKTGLRSLNTARPVNTGHPQKEDQGYVDSGCSRHMTGNMSYLSDFKEFDGGYDTFGGGAKEGKITGKGTLKTDFKLADKSKVLLKVPRKNNMYIVDIKNIVPKESLTCLVTKATLDESMLWHWRLGHVNFKTINKLVKENLVRGLLSKHFENYQTCVACLKGKQHKASCKSKIHNSITQPLFMSHMDLFGPTFVSNLMNKKYCLVVTDDYSIFTWVFFLASKDETSGILKSFIPEIENLVDKKVKIIKCDNGIEFQNRVMSDFCEKKGIKREFSNRVLVVKPHNKTHYELFRDYLGKFDRKSHEGFFVGYSLNSKAFGVYNIRTRKVEESLNIRFLEDKPIIAGDGPKWLFDIDVLTKSRNYVPVVAGTNSNDFVDSLLFDSSLKNASNDEPQPFSDAEKKDDEGVCKESGIADQEKSKNSTQGVNTAGPSINTEPNMFSLGDNATLEAAHADFFSGETEVDMSNITTAYPVPSTPNTRIHKDHLLDHVIGDV
ncbi:putative ribonuclease H-like domain-containing protein [Tanacetum coccineum]